VVSLARRPHERARDVDDEVGAVVQGDGIEGGGGVLGHRNDHRTRLARHQHDERDDKDKEDGESRS
jgi:hypothetical protein